jgi:hypothetical protein
MVGWRSGGSDGSILMKGCHLIRTTTISKRRNHGTHPVSFELKNSVKSIIAIMDKWKKTRCAFRGQLWKERLGHARGKDTQSLGFPITFPSSLSNQRLDLEMLEV